MLFTTYVIFQFQYHIYLVSIVEIIGSVFQHHGISSKIVFMQLCVSSGLWIYTLKFENKMAYFFQNFFYEIACNRLFQLKKSALFQVMV